ncbi:bifunctional lysylphosphatidylglycerol synthetase/lysine--tRNA ligase LysX [Kocuria sp.]|uniref:bifunctional lysylphosphatidylglycerol synthetase/lysine--tRNA ligase LysX n=1 Tax=Kocuria sp. TaxID=1871328 RepID=UPI0026E04C89|nr:bifunctional lysylphosphatidylglycerol synthetase/lysine--tRNA ligase LysX [Kocuria sp.]MDO5619024.1 bifunctional lysylphosphatidylglycerol synthetase/lysine--tRNA ligase LysX [Kocuria sp.]
MSHPSPPTRPLEQRDPVAERLARILTWVWTLAAAVAVALWILRITGPLTVVPVVVFGALNIPVTPSLVSAILVGLVAAALVRRMRLALLAVMAFSVFGMIVSILILTDQWIWSTNNHGIFPYAVHVAIETTGIVVGGLTLIAAIRSWKAFPARVRPGAGWVAAATGAVGLLISLVLTQALIVATTQVGWTQFGELGRVFWAAMGSHQGGWRHIDAVPPWVPQIIAIVLAVVLILTVWTLLRAGRRSAQWTADGELHLRELLAQHGDLDSLGWFATRRDKEVVFSADGRAAVTFRTIGAVSLASGDPVGDPHSWPAAIAQWKDQARRYGLLLGVISASEAGARAYADRDSDGLGMAVTTMGDEAVLHADRFTLSSTNMTEVRRAVRRARRDGLTVTVQRHQDVDPIELADLGVLADQWRGAEPDRGFSMALNRWGDLGDGRSVVVVARDAQGQAVGLLSFVPWGRRGLSLDVMRRSPQAPNGVSEFMIAELMRTAEQLGVAKVSLNFAMFRGVFADADRLGAGAMTRFNSGVLGRLDRFFQLERLYRFNDKFHPEWVPRYVVYENLLTLPRVAIASGIAEGFVPDLWPRSGRGATGHDGHSLTAEQQEQIRQTEQRLLEPQADAVLSELGPRRTPEEIHRKEHADHLAECGEPPWPVGILDVDPLAVAVEALATPGRSVRFSGRVRHHRDHGGVQFLTLTEAGADLQVVMERAAVGQEQFELLNHTVDLGDILVVDGRSGSSRNGTPSILASGLTVAAKSLRPVPFAGFEDPEARLRRRSLDLVVHPDRLRLLHQRATVIQTVRHFLLEAGLREVETPVLNTVHGGASARPFRTWINAYGMGLSLRIAPELYLKRLLVGGYGPLFEVARNFRNEGADATHNPEFTALEAYVPWADYTTMRHLTEAMVKAAATALYGRPELPLVDVHRSHSNGDHTRNDDAAPTVDSQTPQILDISGPWRVRTVTEAVSEAVGQEVSVDTDIDVLLQLARDNNVPVGPAMGPGAVLEELYGELVEPNTMEPTFYCDFPVETSPLTAPHRSKPGLVERWDLVVGGMELGTAYSEMTDPVEQRRRFTQQSLKAAAGDPEAMEIDEEFLSALELGMPPTGGLGIGLDRLVMVLTGTTIRDVLAFPFVRPRPGRD